MSDARSPRSLSTPAEIPHIDDRLAALFVDQRRLMDKYHDIEGLNGSAVVPVELEGQLDSRRVQARLHELYGYLSRELAEAMAELKNKPWKQTEEPTVEDNFVEEVGDALHFFIEFCLTAGIGPNELFRVYHRTQLKNEERQASGY